MRYLLGIGYVNRSDLLVKAVTSVSDLWKNVVVIDNSPSGSLQTEALLPEAVSVYTPPVPLTLPQTMNLLHRMAAERNCDAVLFMHNDAEAGAGTPNQLLKRLNNLQSTGTRWGAVTAVDNALSAYNMAAVRAVGPWDTVFPHYLADHDYLRRLKLSGYEVIQSDLPVHHHNNGGNTIKSNVHLKEMNDLNLPLYETYYNDKWGGKVGAEQYSLLFNQFPLNPVPDYLAFVDPENKELMINGSIHS
ncbi:hypothetical protein VN24_05885 [Paenibacillus beijingensis]|uniref:Glycosyltransferase 2-like domain-containing protein n=2 Tax=Paenibacillus beijingensis TaxID=1126833 RepID=A0A0D5NQD8_9BACL|nr:hypothetical protein VN24_05885 [Paenibacillus beijingensis]